MSFPTLRISFQSVLVFTFFIPGQVKESYLLSPHSFVVGQGKTLAVYLNSEIPLKSVEGNFLDKTLPFLLSDKERVEGTPFTYRSLIGIPIETKPDSYLFRISITKVESSVESLFTTIQVVETPFEKEEITIPPPKENLLTSDALLKESEIFRKILSEVRENQYWEGRFFPPIEGRISSPFGIYRIYNDGTSSRPHRGVDLANLEGTPILAPNSGRIVLSRNLEFHGNTLIIDHGQGVYTILNHLKRRFARKGDKVKKGETVGLVGETGFATGPHVHWGLSIHDVRVDALEWTEKEW